MIVRNLSGTPINQWDRSTIQDAVEHYLGMKNDHLDLVVTSLWGDVHDEVKSRPVKEGYTTQEIIADLEGDEDYSNQVWWVCRLSPSFKTVMVKEVIHYKG